MPVSDDVPLKGYGNKTPRHHPYVESKTTVIDTAKQKPVAGKRKKAQKTRQAPKASASSQRSYAKMPKMEEVAKLLIATNPNKRLTIEELI